MSHSLDRLINLAKKTGDRLIVHDPFEGRDMVIMNVDEYERMALGREEYVYDLTSNEMLDRINRDIAIWRSNRDMDMDWERSPFDTDRYVPDIPEFFDDKVDSGFPGMMDMDDEDDLGWASTSDVIESRYGKFEEEGEEEIPMPSFSDMNDKDEDETPFDGMPFDTDLPTTPEPRPLPIEEIPFVAPEGEIDWSEEPLPNEDPVFLEEPV